MRIAVMGYSGSGKSTLARALGQRHGCPVVHMDILHFRKNWEERPNEVAMFLLKPWLDEPSWVIDGNYHSLGFEERIELADKIIILQLPRLVCLFRAYRRYRKYQGQVRPDMAPGCPEKFDLPFVWWILHKGRNKQVRLRYQKLLNTYPDKCIVCRSRQDVDALSYRRD